MIIEDPALPMPHPNFKIFKPSTTKNLHKDKLIKTTTQINRKKFKKQKIVYINTTKETIN
jgi:hypothetical protein